MPRQRLSRIMTFTGTSLMAAVAISWEFIWNDPSPAMQTTVASGFATAAPMAAGKPKPMVPSPPEERKVRGNSRGKNWCAHIWCWPTSVVTMEAAGSSWRPSSAMTSSGTISSLSSFSAMFGW